MNAYVSILFFIVIVITKKPTSASTKPLLPPTSDFPKAAPSPSIPDVVFYSNKKEVEPKKDEPRSNKDNGGSRHWQIWLQAVVASVLSSCAVVCLVVVVLLIRARRKRSLQKRREGGGNNGEGFSLNEIPNDEEEKRLPPPNADGEQRLQPNDGERLPQPACENGEKHLRRPSEEELVEGYSQRPKGVVEIHVARQETQPPVQCATPSSSTIVG